MHLYNYIWVVLLIPRLNLVFLSPKLSHGIHKVLVNLCPCGFDNPRNTLRWKLLQLASVRLWIILLGLRTANISLSVVCDLDDVVGLRLLSLCATLWIDNVVLSLCFWLVKNEHSSIRRSLLSFRFVDKVFCFRWCCKNFVHWCFVQLWMVVPLIKARGTTAPSCIGH
jgi:hypothetical protein